MPSLLPSDLYGGVYKSIVADPQSVRSSREQVMRSGAERAELLRKQQQAAELEKVLGGVRQGDEASLTRFFQLDPKGAIEYEAEQQKQRDAKNQARTQGLMGLFGLPPEQQASAYPQYRQQLGGAESGLPEQFEPNSLMAMMHTGIKPETQVDLRPKIEKPESKESGGQIWERQPDGTWKAVTPKSTGGGKAPTIGSFEDYTIKKYGANPTAEQIMEARKEWESSKKPPFKLSEKMSNQITDFGTGINLLNDLVDNFNKNIAQGAGGTGTFGSYVAGGIERIPYAGGKIAPDTRAYNDQSRLVAENILRAVTGAAAPVHEVAFYRKLLPSPGMNQQEANSKLDAFVSGIRSKAVGVANSLRIQGREEEALEVEKNINALLANVKKVSFGSPKEGENSVLREKYNY